MSHVPHSQRDEFSEWWEKFGCEIFQKNEGYVVALAAWRAARQFGPEGAASSEAGKDEAKDVLIRDMMAEAMRVGMGAPFDKARFSRLIERGIELVPPSATERGGKP